MNLTRRHTALIAFLAAPLFLGAAFAQVTPRAPGRDTGTTPPVFQPGQGALSLTAGLGAGAQNVQNGLRWRIAQERAEPDGSHAIVSESTDANPMLPVPDGDYIVHVAYGLASAMKRVSINGRLVSERLVLNAGALKVNSVLGDAPLPDNRLSIDILVPERGNSEARKVVQNATPGEIIRLPEGNYRIISTYLEKETAGSTGAPGAPVNATNSVVNAELRVQAGKLTQATLRHRAAVMTLKLVNAAGGEALANTNFSVLTPGGDVIREMIGAFPSLVLAEGEYVVIARNSGKTWQATFKVQSTLDRDVEVIAK